MRLMNVEARMQVIWDAYHADNDRAAQVLAMKKLIYCMKDERDELAARLNLMIEDRDLK